MEPNKALAVVPQQQAMTLTDSQQVSKIMYAAGLFKDTQSEAQALVKVLYGQELGVGPIAAMTGIIIAQGRISFAANFMASRVKASGKYNFRISEHTDQACAIDFFERTKDGWDKVGTSRFTIEDAKRAGINNANYGKYPRNMLFARAMSNGAKFYAADAFGGITPYVPEDFGAAIDPDTGNVIEGEATPVAQAASKPAPAPAPAPKPQTAALQTIRCPRLGACVGTGQIEPTEIQGRVYSAQEIAAATEKRLGVRLCYACGQAEKARREAQAAPPPESFHDNAPEIPLDEQAVA